LALAQPQLERAVVAGHAMHGDEALVGVVVGGLEPDLNEQLRSGTFGRPTMSVDKAPTHPTDG
jgi:hypothetical protein